ncbi:MAG TPA: sugar transferase [Verrucomicrobiota bacterium]|nr:sugar transferase [Verrucomicrobiota bacterium]HNT15575.1 sugar transferase [Verrucomicrobiota bacterium]
MLLATFFFEPNMVVDVCNARGEHERFRAVQKIMENVENRNVLTVLKPNQVQEFRGGEANGSPLWKRLLDAIAILCAAPVIILVGAIIAMVIKIGSPGPILFRQERIGYKGRRFVCFKFRTMHVGAETSSHQGHTANLIKSDAPMTKLDAAADARIIPLGRILRATGLDELPQLINVLAGDMSIVGPRPCVRYEYEMYESWQKRRFDAVPGLTGLWQVSGKNRTTFNQMIHFDIEYSERMNVWLDLKIMAKTPLALLQQCRDQKVGRTATTKGQRLATSPAIHSAVAISRFGAK